MEKLYFCNLKIVRKMKSEVVLGIVFVFLFFFISCIDVNAVTTQKRGTIDSYQPLHVAILMDSSGSIKGADRNDSSDPDLISRDAAKAFLNCIPSNKNKVALYYYNDVVERVNDLTSVDKPENIAVLNNSLSAMKNCGGHTHMLSAIKEANEYLVNNSSDECRNVIIVFTDGAEDEKLKPESTDKEIKQEVQKKLGNTDTVVYSVAFDYFDKKQGNHSINNEDGSVGYGKKILDEIAEKTGGKVMETKLNDINELDDKFIDIINDLCNIYPEQIGKYDGDGKSHTTEFVITDSVVEADLRISCDTLDATKDAVVTVKKPGEGEEYTFSNDNNDNKKDPTIWYNVDRLAINIKIINPSVGKWKLTVAGLKSKSPVYVNLIRQYNMSLKVKKTTPSGKNDEAVLGKSIGLEVKLNSDGKEVDNEYFYDLSHMTACAFVTEGSENFIDFSQYDSRRMLDNFVEVLKNRPKTEMFEMKSTGKSFTADIPMNNLGENVIGVWISAERFYCYEDDLIDVVHIFEPLSGKDIEDMELKCGEKKTVDDLSSYSGYADADLKIDIVKGKGEVIDVNIENNTLVVEGNKAGSQEIVLKYTSSVDGQYFEKKFNVVVLNTPPIVPKSMNIDMSVGETYTESNILDDIEDDDGDILSISNVYTDNVDVAEVVKNDQDVVIRAGSVGNAAITVEVTDGFNTVKKMINVTVRHPTWVWVLCICVTLAVLFLIAVLVVKKKKASRRFHTTLNHVCLVICPDKAPERHYRLKYPFILSNKFEKRCEINFEELLQSMITEETFEQDDISGLVKYIETYEDRLAEFKKVSFIGRNRANEPDNIKSKNTVGMKFKLGTSGSTDMIDTDVVTENEFELIVCDEKDKAIFKFVFETERSAL